MTLLIGERIKETTTVTSTGTATLLGAVTGYQAFSVIGNGNTTYYTIENPGTTEWEVGIGTYTLSGTTLARTTVLASSNSGSLVNFSAGTKNVFCSYPASRAITGGGGGIGALVINADNVAANYTVDTGTNAMSVGPITVASGITVTIASGQRWVVL